MCAQHLSAGSVASWGFCKACVCVGGQWSMWLQQEVGQEVGVHREGQSGQNQCSSLKG